MDQKLTKLNDNIERFASSMSNRINNTNMNPEEVFNYVYNKGIQDANQKMSINYVDQLQYPNVNQQQQQVNTPRRLALPPASNNQIVPYQRQPNRFQNYRQFRPRQPWNTTFRPRFNNNYQPRFMQPRNNFAHPNRNDFCYYHRKWGNQAQRCTQPCTWNGPLPKPNTNMARRENPKVPNILPIQDNNNNFLNEKRTV